MDQYVQPPCRIVRTLDGEAGCVSAALEHTRDFLDRYAPDLPPRVAEDLLLLVSELVTNAVRHAPGPCTLALECDGRLQVAVTDSSTAGPAPRVPDLSEGSGGFGWHLVTAVADGVEVRRGPPGGKTITATLTAVGTAPR